MRSASSSASWAMSSLVFMLRPRPGLRRGKELHLSNHKHFPDVDDLALLVALVALDAHAWPQLLLQIGEVHRLAAVRTRHAVDRTLHRLRSRRGRHYRAVPFVRPKR